jgi:hypothetical protein
MCARDSGVAGYLRPNERGCAIRTTQTHGSNNEDGFVLLSVSLFHLHIVRATLYGLPIIILYARN